jgi:hypothetical protein
MLGEMECCYTGAFNLDVIFDLKTIHRNQYKRHTSLGQPYSETLVSALAAASISTADTAASSPLLLTPPSSALLQPPPLLLASVPLLPKLPLLPPRVKPPAVAGLPPAAAMPLSGCCCGPHTHLWRW